MRMLQKIGFFGKGGIGKSVVVSHISVALSRMGYHVLQVGNDLSLSSTVLLRKNEKILPAMEVYCKKYEISLEDLIVKSESGVYCLELGSVTPGMGCIARGVELMTEMLCLQNIIEKLSLDYILYDLTIEAPCTGQFRAIRNGMFDRSILITGNTFASLCTVNAILQAMEQAVNHIPYCVQIIMNQVNCESLREEINAYASKTNIPVLCCIYNLSELGNCCQCVKNVFELYPDSEVASMFMHLAYRLIQEQEAVVTHSFERNNLIDWDRMWKKLGEFDVYNFN